MRIYDKVCAVLLSITFCVPLFVLMALVVTIVFLAYVLFALPWLLRRAIFMDNQSLKDWVWSLPEKWEGR